MVLLGLGQVHLQLLALGGEGCVLLLRLCQFPFRLSSLVRQPFALLVRSFLVVLAALHDVSKPPFCVGSESLEFGDVLARSCYLLLQAGEFSHSRFKLLCLLGFR